MGNALRSVRSNRWLGKIILLVGGLVGGGLLVEIGLRLAGISFPRVIQRDDNRGAAYRPGNSWWQSDEGFAYVQINNEGFRDRERTPEKPADCFRIAVLGDSYVDAVQVAMDERFTEVIERELNQKGRFSQPKVEVLNFGFSGCGTAEQLQTLRHHVWKYSPDLVILCFFVGNDVRDNSKALKLDSGRPYFVYQDDKLVFDDSFRRTPEHVKSWMHQVAYRFIDYSRIVQVIYKARQRRISRALSAAMVAENTLVDPDSPIQELGIDAIVCLEPVEEIWKEAWRVTEGLLGLMNQDVRSHGARFMVVTLSSPISVHPDANVRRKFMNQWKIENMFYAEDRVQSVGNREGFPVLQLGLRFQEHGEKNQVFLHGFNKDSMGRGHWNADGHKFAGQLIAEKVVEIVTAN